MYTHTSVHKGRQRCVHVKMFTLIYSYSIKIYIYIGARNALIRKGFLGVRQGERTLDGRTSGKMHYCAVTPAITPAFSIAKRYCRDMCPDNAPLIQRATPRTRGRA